MNLVETIVGNLSGANLSQISQSIGANEQTASKGIAAAVPALISALAGKASQPGGATALFDLLKQGTGSSVVDNLAGYLGNPAAAGGANLVQQILGGGENVASAQIAKVSGLTQGVVGRLLALLAPIVVGALGKAVQTQGLDAAGLTRFLSDQQGFIRSSAPGLLGFLEKIDANDDGSIVDDLSRLAGRLFGRR
jgi:hypothetical protein